MEEVGRQNLAMMERAMSLFTPFLRENESVEAHGSAPGVEDQVNTLRAEVEFLRSQLARVRAGQEGETKPEAAPAPAPRAAAKQPAGQA